eukprot:3621128-Prymnesium_polylepis.1
MACRRGSERRPAWCLTPWVLLRASACWTLGCGEKSRCHCDCHARHSLCPSWRHSVRRHGA